MRLRIWEAKIFRLILLVFLSVIAPVYILGYFFYYRGYSEIKDDITSSLLSQTESTINGLAIDIESVRSMQHDLLTDISLPLIAHRYELMSQFEWFSVVNDFRRQLTAIRLRSGIIEDTAIYIEPEMIVLSAVTGFNRTEGGKAFDIVRAPIARSELGLYQEDNGIFIRSFPVTILDSTFFVLAKINLEQLRGTLSIADTYSDSRFVLIGNGDTILLESLLPDDEVTDRLVSEIAARGDDGVLELIINATRYVIAVKRLPRLQLTFATYIPIRSLLRPVYSYRFWFVFFTFIGIIAISIFSAVFHLLIEKPLKNITQAFKLVQDGNFEISIHHNHDDEFSYLYEAFNDMVVKLKNHIEIEYEQNILLKDAQLNQLQIQINPHFLYNCFFILMGMHNDERYDEAARMVRLLSQYYRYLSKTQSAEVTLAEEISLAQTYCEIQLIRFSRRISVEFAELPSELKDMKVPLMIIQPIIENAFNHGLKDTEKDGIIRTEFTCSGNDLEVAVHDNGSNTDDELITSIQNLLNDSPGEARSHGLTNVHRRIALRFRTEGITISRSDLGGLKVALHLKTGE